MKQIRPDLKHTRRTIGLVVLVAALTIAFGGDLLLLHHRQGEPARVELALGGAGNGGGRGGVSLGHWRSRGDITPGALSRDGNAGDPRGPYGPGDGGEKSGWGGFMPNGEDGLMSVAEFVRGDDGSAGGWEGKHGDGPATFDGVHGSGVSPGGGFSGGSFGGGGGGGSAPKGDGDKGGDKGGKGGGPGPGDGPGVTIIDDSKPDGVGGKGCLAHCGSSQGGGPDDGGWHPGPDLPNGPIGDPPLTSAVPEPATWTMLILGFGLIGSALRAQRRKTGPASA
jgi:hypothetical protein